ncbi:MAG: phosphatase PAP2 family protein [Chloroflexi bacterium]|nr:phosphatase PAP2 family protein [Chloroflexota bacterium]MCL5273909.1 phosphatase PAP2 family protein [Chloroflexota bacterium]
MPAPQSRLPVIIILLCLVALSALTIIVVSGRNAPGDLQVLAAAISARTTFLTQAISVLTFIGSAVPAMVVCLLLSLMELRRVVKATAISRSSLHRQDIVIIIAAAWPLIAFCGAVGIDILMRVLIGRLPPDVERIQQLLPEIRAPFQQFSFPSGHACTVLVTYGALSVIAWRTPVIRWVTLTFAALTIVGVGYGRLYLGVHWPSDVLAGYLLGTTWLMLALIARRHINSGRTAQDYELRVES